MEQEKSNNPIIIAERSQQAKITARKAITRITRNPDAIIFSKDIQTAFEEMKIAVAEKKEIDLFVTDTFTEKEFNIFRLIREMEKSREYWNVPLLVYTHQPDEDMFNRIRKDIVHLPFRILPITLDTSQVEKAISALLDFREENRHYLELEQIISNVVKLGDDSILPGTMKKIDDHAERYSAVLHPAKVGLLKGRVIFNLWREKHPQKGLIQKVPIEPPPDEGLLKEAETFLLTAHEDYPKYWEIIYSLYSLYMAMGRVKEAKKYLEELIDIFPEETKFSFKMGKIDELDENFTNAVERYLASVKNLIDEGVSGYDEQDVVEIVDASLEAAKSVLKGLGLSRFEMEGLEKDSEEYKVMRILKQNNATSRTALIHLTKKSSEDPDLYNRIGITYRRTGEYHNAKDMYSKALKLAPNDHRIKMNFSIALAMSNSWEAAKTEILSAQKINKDKDDEPILERLVKIITGNDQASLEKLLV